MPAAPTGPAQPAAPPQGTSRIGRLLGLTRWLVSYGKNLAEKIRRHAGTPAFAPLAIPFGTTNPATILALVTRGLRLAIALEQRLAERQARGEDIAPHVTRSPSPRTRSSTPRPRDPRPRPEPVPDVVSLPTPEEIAAILRRRPVGAVIADICRDLGILPGNIEPDLWRELMRTFAEYGGNFPAYFNTMMDRLFPLARLCRLGELPDASWRSPPPLPLAPATGPP
jgi:hypothetical protein